MTPPGRRSLLALAVCVFLVLPVLLGGGACWRKAAAATDASTGWNPLPRPVQMVCSALHPGVMGHGGAGVLVGWVIGGGVLAWAIAADRRVRREQSPTARAATAPVIIASIGSLILVPFALTGLLLAWLNERNVRGPECHRREAAAAALWRTWGAANAGRAEEAEAIARALDAHDIEASCRAARALAPAVGVDGHAARQALDQAWATCANRPSFDDRAPGRCLPR
jgi:hypothetical protein